ncbi:hypothetical protein SARC_00761 [Sphaeroforma arctica JP610]|uniref:Uncharacterized protein n=1 Tax=Sphaeroforma arctica JP610 TaxID=667725 RepID=A0A0L0GDL5_9EUKA|nr:hypothetical protein SARC_00761 [Sphaeroforma arctica JP610]KNC87085.1 hypothetical protein SARC_00761 [Sphaeroforma arctica JP610]|eukprot:XP_014160987.1 hypothetical protein SARC_00761 [Sphaeroforma arctica JP610]
MILQPLIQIHPPTYPLRAGVLPNGGTTYIASRGGLRGIRKPLVLVSPHSRCPFYMFTVIKYDPGEKDLQGEADAQSGHFGVQQRTRERGTLSYMQLLESSWPQTDEAKEGLKKRTYIMDDPALRSGKHRQVLALPSIKMSVIQYAKPSDLKRDLNEQFRERHPDLQISLSKMRRYVCAHSKMRR